jgi:O-antigen/teichoic acid export membrane protein
MFGLALVAREFIIVAISEKWTDSVPLLQMLCVGGAFLPFHTLYQNLMIGRGRSDVYMWCTIAQIIVQTTIIIATYRWGINVMVAAFSLLMVAWVAVWQHFARRAIGLSALMAAKDTMPYLAVAAAVMAITWLITKSIEPMVVLLVVRIVVAALLYLIAMKLLGSKMFDECMSYLLKRKK